MTSPLTLGTVAVLSLAPLLWAGNAVVGRMVHELVPPVLLNLLRWSLAFVLLLPLAAGVLRPGSPVWRQWRRYALLGLLGIGLYNTFQYMALQTSTPLNVTLVGSSMPLWMLALGTLFFGMRVSRRQAAGAVLSMLGVLLVLSRGQWSALWALRLVPGDLFMLLATLSWSLYSWLLVKTAQPLPTSASASASTPETASAAAGPAADVLRGHWAHFLMAQMVFGLGWSGLLAGGEWALSRPAPVVWGTPLALALLFIAVGPALIAYRCWGVGVQRVGPAVAGFFTNLTPLFAALLSAVFLGEVPRWYHAGAFVLIVGGIVVSSSRR